MCRKNEPQNVHNAQTKCKKRRRKSFYTFCKSKKRLPLRCRLLNRENALVKIHKKSRNNCILRSYLGKYNLPRLTEKIFVAKNDEILTAKEYFLSFRNFALKGGGKKACLTFATLYVKIFAMIFGHFCGYHMRKTLGMMSSSTSSR